MWCVWVIWSWLLLLSARFTTSSALECLMQTQYDLFECTIQSCITFQVMYVWNRFLDRWQPVLITICRCRCRVFPSRYLVVSFVMCGCTVRCGFCSPLCSLPATKNLVPVGPCKYNDPLFFITLFLRYDWLMKECNDRILIIFFLSLCTLT